MNRNLGNEENSTLKNNSIEQKDHNIEEKTVQKNIEFTQQPHPWVRFFSKMYDYNMAAGILTIIIGLICVAVIRIFRLNLKLDVYDYLIFQYFTIFIYVLFIEPVLLIVFGTTLGKWIFNSKVVSLTGEKLSYKVAINRSISVFVYGLFLYVPIICMFPLIYAFDTLKKNGTTSWDIKCKSQVITGKLNPVKIILSYLLFFIFPTHILRAISETYKLFY